MFKKTKTKQDTLQVETEVENDDHIWFKRKPDAFQEPLPFMLNYNVMKLPV